MTLAPDVSCYKAVKRCLCFGRHCSVGDFVLSL